MTELKEVNELTVLYAKFHHLKDQIEVLQPRYNDLLAYLEYHD